MNRSFPRLEVALDEATVDHDFFFRDDDAGWADDDLLELCNRFVARAPIDLAVIPEAVTPCLASHLIDHRAQLGFHQHGFAHHNHESAGKKCEFGAHRTEEDVVSDLGRGRARLVELFGYRLDPIFTPPWNRCSHATIGALQSIGIEVLSRDRGSLPKSPDGIIELPVAVDWIRWRDSIDEAIAGSIAIGEPTGVMLHHEVMDQSDLEKIDDLLELLVNHPRAKVRSMMQLVRGRHGG